MLTVPMQNRTVGVWVQLGVAVGAAAPAVENVMERLRQKEEEEEKIK